MGNMDIKMQTFSGTICRTKVLEMHEHEVRSSTRRNGVSRAHESI